MPVEVQYPFNAELRISIDIHGNIRSGHSTTADATKGSTLIARIHSPEYAVCVDACFGPVVLEGSVAGDRWLPFTLFILLDNADVFLLCPLLVTPASLPTGLLQALRYHSSESEGGSDDSKWAESLMRSAEGEKGGHLIVRTPPRSLPALPPTIQGPFSIEPEPLEAAANPSFGAVFQKHASKARLIRVMATTGMCTAVLLAHSDGRVDVLALLDDIRACYGRADSSGRQHRLYLIETLSFESPVTDMQCAVSAFWARCQNGHVWQVQVLEGDGGDAPILKTKLIAQQSSLLSLRMHGDDVLVEYDKDRSYNYSATELAIPADFSSVSLTVDALWPPFSYPTVGQLRSGMPTPPPDMAKHIFPEGLDEESVVAVNQLVLQWRRTHTAPLIAAARQVNRRGRALLDWIIRMQTVQSRLDAKLLGPTIRGCYSIDAASENSPESRWTSLPIAECEERDRKLEEQLGRLEASCRLKRDDESAEDGKAMRSVLARLQRQALRIDSLREQIGSLSLSSSRD